MTTLFSASIFSVSALAKRRGGGGRVGSINDNWDVPGLVKATMTFEIIWFIFSLVQLYYIIKSLRLIPTMSARAPYILLLVVTLLTTVGYLLWGIFTRIADDIDYITGQGIDLTLTFLLGFTYAFRSAAVLWLVQQRATVLQAIKGNTTVLLAAQTWKRVLDWVLVGLVFLFYIVTMGMDGTYYAAANNYTLTTSQARQYIQAKRGVYHTTVALSLLLSIDVVASVIMVFAQGKAAKWTDSVVRCLLVIVAPLVAILAIELLATDIYSATTLNTRTIDDAYSLILAEVIIEGFCAVGITAGVIATMSLPGVQWTPQPAGVPATPATYPGTPGPQGSTPNSGWTQPLYNQQPYYPQQQTYFQQPQQPQQPYSIPVHAGPH